MCKNHYHRHFMNFIESFFLRTTGYTYSNLSRLFIRLFVGVMFIQFGIRQLVNFHAMVPEFPAVMGLSSEASLVIMIVIELVCSLCIMVGFLTRLAVIPALISMIIAVYYVLHISPDDSIAGMTDMLPGYLPVMFAGIFMYLLLSGPGKISLDYFISLYILSRRGKDETQTKELEEV